MTEDSLAWTTLESTVSYECPGFAIKTERVRLPDGRETTFDYLAEPPAVVILPVTDDEAVVAIQEWRQPVRRTITSLPAGSVEDEDDDLEAAARRELAEETGYECRSLEYLTAAESANGVANSTRHYFVASGCTPTAERDLDHNESIRVLETDLQTLRAQILGAEPIDSRAALGVLYYDEHMA